MLESIREGVKKPWVKIVIFAIVISFVFAGYFSSSFFLGDPNAVAIVNGESISRGEFQQEYNNFKAQRADYYKANVKTEEDERNFQESVLQRLITFKVREQAIKELGLRLSTEELKNIIHSDKNYQVDGVYSPDLVQQTLIRAKMSKEQFKNAYAEQGVTKQLISGMMDSEFALPVEAKTDYQLIGQKRTGRAMQVNTAPFSKELEISDEQKQNYYQENLDSFRVEEKVSVNYIELSVADLQGKQELSEERIKNYYEENLDRYKAEEQRRVSHILVLSEDDEAAALAKIEEIKKRIDSGESFEEIAKVESDDVPTRESGGDLGVLITGAMEEPFENAAKELQNVGDVSEPVKSEFGFHLIKLTSLEEGSAQPLEQVRDELVTELQKNEAEAVFYAKSSELARLAFEVSDSLQEAAEKTGLEVKTSPLFGANSNEGIFANQAIKDAAFSSDVKDAKLNSEAIQINDKHVVVLRLKDYQPSKVQPFEDVEKRVETSLRQSIAKEAASEVANTILDKLKAGDMPQELMDKHQLKWQDLDKLQRNNAQLSFLANREFFKMPEPQEGKVSYNVVEDFQGYTVLMLSSVTQGNWAEADEATQKQRKLFLNSYFSNAELSAFIEHTRKNSDITRNLNNLIQ